MTSVNTKLPVASVAVLGILWLDGDVGFCKLLGKGCSKNLIQKFRNESESYSVDSTSIRSSLIYTVYLPHSMQYF